jgi:uncharacterized damage-inducible protein DinB
MDAAERSRVLGELKAGRDALGAALAGVDDQLALRKASAEAWSILGCVEHVVKTERYLLGRLNAATLADQPFEKWRREAKIAARAGDRSLRIEAPEQAHPHGQFRTLAEAMAAFDETRDKVVRWVEECANDPRRLMTDHVLIEGPVTCAETLVMIAAHPARHAKQIEEIKRAFSGASNQR